jgi:hypothetical protein
MKLQNPDLPTLLRKEIFYQLGVEDPGGGIATSLNGQEVLFGECDVIENRSCVLLVDAYNTLNITNFEPPRRGMRQAKKNSSGRKKLLEQPPQT